MNRISPMLILAGLPHTQDTGSPFADPLLLVKRRRGRRAHAAFLLVGIMVVMYHDVLPILVLAALPHAQDAAAASSALGGRRGHHLDLGPDAGAASLADRPGVLFVRGDGPVLLVLALFVDGGHASGTHC